MRPAFWGIVGERTGIEGFDWTQRVSTKKRREHLAKLSLQEVPREYAQHLFEMAARDVDPRIGAVPKEYEEVARRMGPAAGWTPDLHQAWALLGMDPRLQALAPPWFGLFRQGLALWHLPEVRAWRLYPDEGRRIRAFARTTSLGASMRSCSRIYFSQRVRRERWALRLLDLVVRLKQQAAELGGPLPKQIEVLPSVAGTLAAHLLREHSDPALNPFAAGLMFRTVQAKKPARRQEPLTAEPAEAQPQDQAQPPSLEQETHEPSDLSL
jgi:hypothetical protein